MECYSLIVVTDETAPVRRFDVRRGVVRTTLWALAIGVAMLLIGVGDYIRLRIERPELAVLRVETANQRAQIDAFESRVVKVGRRLEQVLELERKVRIIANLPGSAGTGGAAGGLTAAPRSSSTSRPAGPARVGPCTWRPRSGCHRRIASPTSTCLTLSRSGCPVAA